jgi:hypothetical protein
MEGHIFRNQERGAPQQALITRLEHWSYLTLSVRAGEGANCLPLCTAKQLEGQKSNRSTLSLSISRGGPRMISLPLVSILPKLPA